MKSTPPRREPERNILARIGLWLVAAALLFPSGFSPQAGVPQGSDRTPVAWDGPATQPTARLRDIERKVAFEANRLKAKTPQHFGGAPFDLSPRILAGAIATSLPPQENEPGAVRGFFLRAFDARGPPNRLA